MKPAGTASRSPCQPQRKRPTVQADDLLVERVEGSDEKGAAVASGEQHGPACGGSVGEQEPAVERRSRVARKRELAVLEDERAQAVWRVAFCPLAWREGRPCDRRLVERAGRDVGEIGGRLAAEHEQRAVRVGPDRAAHVAVDDGDRRGSAQLVNRRDGLADARRERGPPRSEPIFPVESNRHRAVGRDVHAQSICCGQAHARSLSNTDEPKCRRCRRKHVGLVVQGTSRETVPVRFSRPARSRGGIRTDPGALSHPRSRRIPLTRLSWKAGKGILTGADLATSSEVGRADCRPQISGVNGSVRHAWVGRQGRSGGRRTMRNGYRYDLGPCSLSDVETSALFRRVCHLDQSVEDSH